MYYTDQGLLDAGIIPHIDWARDRIDEAVKNGSGVIQGFENWVVVFGNLVQDTVTLYYPSTQDRIDHLKQLGLI